MVWFLPCVCSGRSDSTPCGTLGGEPARASEQNAKVMCGFSGREGFGSHTSRLEIFVAHLSTGEAEHGRGEGCGSEDHSGRAHFSSTILNCSAWPQTCILPSAKPKPLSCPGSPPSERRLARVSGILPCTERRSNTPLFWTLSEDRCLCFFSVQCNRSLSLTATTSPSPKRDGSLGSLRNRLQPPPNLGQR